MPRIDNKKDLPYGIFHVGYADPFQIEGKYYDNVIDYITREYGRINEPYDISLEQMWTYFENSAINRAIQEGIDAKASVDTVFDGLLLSSETKPIKYQSENAYLGVGGDGRGENVYGKWLVNYRNSLMDNNSSAFYNVYVLDRLLKVAINYESLEKYLQMARNGIGVKAMINVLYQKYGKFIDIPSREVIEQIRVQTKQAFVYKTEDIVLNVLKSKLRQTRALNLGEFRYKIFQIFVKNVAKKYNIEYDAVKFINLMDKSEREYSIDRVFEGYRVKVLDGVTQAVVPDKYIPTPDDVNKYESETIKGFSEEPIPSEKTTNVALVDHNTSRLSLKDDRIVFQVRDKKFPSIAHYIIYKTAGLINDANFDPYGLVYDKNSNGFYRLEDSNRFLNDSIRAFKTHHFDNATIEGLGARLDQQPHLRDFLKSTTDDEYVIVRGFKNQIVSDFYNRAKYNISWKSVMNQKGSVINFVDSDDFFVFIQNEMFTSFLNILTIATPANFTHSNVKKVYETFFGSVPGTLNDSADRHGSISNLVDTGKAAAVSLDKKSYEFLKKKFVARILAAEQLSKRNFNNTDVVFMTKFMIVESRYRIFNGALLDEGYDLSDGSREGLAMAKIINGIAQCNDFNVMTKDHIDRAFAILNGDPKKIYAVKISDNLNANKMIDTKTNMEVQTENYPENYFTEEPQQEVLDDENDAGEEREIEGYDERQESEDEEDAGGFNDLMFAPANQRINPRIMADRIAMKLNPSPQVLKYLRQKVDELRKSTVKNIYRINLYQ